MARTRSAWITRLGAAVAAALALCPRATSAEDDALLATLDKPAAVTVQRAPPPAETAAPRRTRVIISVTNYSPPVDCTPVQVVVTGRTDGGAELEVGRFAITPNRAFDAAAPEAQRFALPLPAGLATDKPVRFTVHLVPVEGARPNSACPGNQPKGSRRGGASVRIGAVEIQ